LFDEHEIWNVLTQIVMALSALHKKNVFHRDLKVRKILTKECQCVYEQRRFCKTGRSQCFKSS